MCLILTDRIGDEISLAQGDAPTGDTDDDSGTFHVQGGQQGSIGADKLDRAADLFAIKKQGDRAADRITFEADTDHHRIDGTLADGLSLFAAALC